MNPAAPSPAAAPLRAALERGGVFTALVTPFDRSGHVDLPALATLVERQVAAGVAGLVPCGTTGESPTLSLAETAQVIEVVVATARGRVPVIAGAGANATAKACELTRLAAELGCQGTLQVSPYYNKPTQGGLVAHFTAIADASPLPIVLYNIPGRTAVRIEAETLATLAANPRFVADKEATGDLAFAARVHQLAPSLVLLAGDDALTLPMMSIGATGVVSVAANVAPREVVALVAAAAAGDLPAARAAHYKLLALFQSLFLETNPIPVKAAMELLGACASSVRLPLLPATEPTRAALRRELGGLGLLG